MNLAQPYVIGVGIAAAILTVLAFIIYRLFHTLNLLNKSFAKLGYVTREDAKLYFGEAADKVADMNSTFYQQYQKMIEDGVRKVLAESGDVMEGSLVKAEQDAGTILLKAQQDALQIVDSTKNDSKHYYDQAILESVDTIEWTLEQYLKTHLDVKQHEDIIDNLLKAYIHERRP